MHIHSSRRPCALSTINSFKSLTYLYIVFCFYEKTYLLEETLTQTEYLRKSSICQKKQQYIDEKSVLNYKNFLH